MEKNKKRWGDTWGVAKVLWTAAMLLMGLVLIPFAYVSIGFVIEKCVWELTRTGWLYEPGVITGKGIVENKIVSTDGRKGPVWRVQRIEYDGTEGEELILLREHSVTIRDAKTYKKEDEQKLHIEISMKPELFYNEKSKAVELINHGQSFETVGHYKMTGFFIWKNPGPDHTAPKLDYLVDDQTGELSYFVGDHDGVKAYSGEGDLLWENKGLNVNGLVTFAGGNSEERKIVIRGNLPGEHFGHSRSSLMVLDEQGKMIVPPVKSSSHIDEMEKITLAGKEYLGLVTLRDDKIIYSISENLELKRFYEVSDYDVISREPHDVTGRFVRFNKDQSEYFALLSRYPQAIDRSILNIVSPDGEVIYKELFGTTLGIEAVPNDDGTENLLIADWDGNIFSYSLN